MRVLVACEFSGIVRTAFYTRGHDAYSCDLLPTELPGPHYQCDVREVLGLGWDLMIAHPPCTHLCSSGARHFKYKRNLQADAVDFVWSLMKAPISKIAIENPIGVLSTELRKPDQIIQPWQFGHKESKATCLWLKGLSPLVPTKRIFGLMNNQTPSGQNNVGPSPTRAADRSRTYFGIAMAMADQWGR